MYNDVKITPRGSVRRALCRDYWKLFVGMSDFLECSQGRDGHVRPLSSGCQGDEGQW